MSDWISVIVTTYDREDVLDTVLRALSRQTDRRFEVIVADDGSGPSTAALVEKWRQKYSVPLGQVRHEHNGFRAAEIRNRAVLVARGAYCIFIDDDCLPRPGFVAAHRRLATTGWLVIGNWVEASELLTEFSLRPDQELELWTLATWMGMRSYRAIDRLTPLFRLPLGPLRSLYPRQWERGRSRNLGVWRSDLDRVDGFDAAFTGWGLEDSDLLARLVHAGIRCKDGNYAATVVHLWHPPPDRSAFDDNRDRLIDTLRTKRVRAVAGLSTLSDDVGKPDSAALPNGSGFDQTQ